MKRILLSLLVALALAQVLRAGSDDERLAQLREEIKTIEGVAADAANAKDRPRFDHRLEQLRQELQILEKRQALDNQERDLRTDRKSSPREELWETLQQVPADSVAAEARLGDLATRRVAAAAARDALNQQIAALPKESKEPKESNEGKETKETKENKETPDEAAIVARRAAAEEKLFSANEQMRAIARQQQAAEDEIDLVHQAQALREHIHASDAPVHPSLRTLFSDLLQVSNDSGADQLLQERLTNVGESLGNSEAALEQARQKLVSFDQQLQLLEQQTGFLHRNPKVEEFLVTEQAQKDSLGARLPFLTDQVDALRKSRDVLKLRQELNTLEGRYFSTKLKDLRAAYLRLLYVPAIVGVSLIVLYLLASRFILPRHYHKEELFLARRLGRYCIALIIAAVVGISLIEDITLLATTLGLVSAALVISVQDVFASFFGWFAIMLGRKFTIGDRLEIEGVRGDVLDIQILRTTLMEVNNWLGVDQPTGRVIFVPNNFVFKSKVFNFSHGHPYIWNKIEVEVTYSTPAASAMALFTKVLEEETRSDFELARTAATVMERRYGVEDADYHPKIYTRIADSGVIFSLIYVSHFRDTAITRNRINRRLIAELESHEHIQLAYNTLAIQQIAGATEGPSAVLGQDSTNAPFPSVVIRKH